MTNRINMGKDIQAERKAQGLTQAEVSKRCGLPTSTLSNMERGRFKGSIDLYERYLAALGLQLSVGPRTLRPPTWDEIPALFPEDE
ncbi:MAG: helix-turn-helix domain-containing protein [Litorivicinus sp.]